MPRYAASVAVDTLEHMFDTGAMTLLAPDLDVEVPQVDPGHLSVLVDEVHAYGRAMHVAWSPPA